MLIISEGPSYSIVAQPPTRRIVRIDGWDNNRWDDFYLSFPFILFKINFLISKNKKYVKNSLRVAFSTDINSQKIYYPSLPNIDNSLFACLTQSIDIEELIFSTKEEMYFYNINRFWTTKFYGYQESRNNYKNNSLLYNFQKWQRKTKENPNWIPDENDLILHPNRTLNNF